MEQGISIIISAYKAENFIEDCLNSIEHQSHFKNNKEYEILVGVDGCESTLNKLLTIRHKYNNLHIYNMDSNKGPYITTNTLLTLVKYDNIVKFDADDVMKLDLINNIMKRIAKFDVIRFTSLNFKKNISDSIKGPICHGSLYMKRHVINKLGSYKPWVCGADTDFLNRMKNMFKVGLIKNAFYRRIHDDSLTNRSETDRTSKIRLSYISQLSHQFEYISPVINTYKKI